MAFTELRGAVAVQPQHLGHGGHAVRALPRLSRERGRGLSDRSKVVRVMIAPGQQSRPGRRAKRGGVEFIVAQPIIRQCLHCGHVDGSAKGAGLAEAHVIDQHDQHIRRLVRRPDLKSRWWRGVPRVELGAVRVLRFRQRQHRAVCWEHHGRPSALGHRRCSRRQAKQQPDPQAESRHRQNLHHGCSPSPFSRPSAPSDRKATSGSGQGQ